MARFCAECGSPLPEDARFCGERGAPVTQETVPEAGTAQPPAEEAPPTAAESAPVGQTAENPSAAQHTPPVGPPAWETPGGAPPKKPLPRWVLPVGIGVAAVAILLGATALILGSLHSPERTAEKFLQALGAGDFAALSDVAVTEDGTPLTAEAAEPLFRLYSEDIAFRMELEDLLEDDEERIDDGRAPGEGDLANLQAQPGFLHTAYRVTLGTCSVTFGSNLSCEVTLDGGRTVQLAADSLTPESGAASDSAASPDYYRTEWSTGALYDVLPGLYTVSGTLTTGAGETFTAETQLQVRSVYDSYCELYFDYATLEIENDSEMEVELYLNGSGECYDTIPAESYYRLGPVTAETQVEARADVGADEPMTETFSADEGYRHLSFFTCTVEVYNDYGMKILVSVDGAEEEELPPGEELVLERLAPGTVLRFEMYDEALVQPAEFVCEDEYRMLVPEFEGLTDEAMAGALEAVAAYVDRSLALYNGGDLEVLQGLSSAEPLPLTEFSRDLAESLADDQSYTLEDDGMTVTSTFTRTGDVAYYEDAGVGLEGEDPDTGAAQVSLSCEIPLEVVLTNAYDDGSSYSGNERDEVVYPFLLQYADGVWTVAG